MVTINVILPVVNVNVNFFPKPGVEKMWRSKEKPLHSGEGEWRGVCGGGFEEGGVRVV
jgi:hypothetical protein